MYLKNKWVKALKVKNVLLTIAAVCEFLVSASVAIDLLVYYHDDIDTALHAKAMPDCIRGIIVSACLFIITFLSRKMIAEATFFSSYFEGSLDGYIRFEDLAKVVGRPTCLVRAELHVYRFLYMKKFAFVNVEEHKQVELESKKTLCECKSCGAPIEKRVFFTGTCQYCGSSDIHAKILSGDQFYSISSDVNLVVNRPDYYEGNGLTAKKVLFPILIVLSVSMAIVLTMFVIDYCVKYNDKDYLTKVMLNPDNHLYSFDLIQKDMLSTIVGVSIFALGFYALFVRRTLRALCVRSSAEYAEIFAKWNKPFVPVSKLEADEKKRKRKVRKVRGAIRLAYLQHCTLEMHEDALKIALAKKIVKDRCPSCAAPIVGAVDEEYVCQHCGNKIMGVIEKK